MSDDRVSYLHARDPSIDRSRRVCPKKKFKLLDRVAEVGADMNGNDAAIEENDENSMATANSMEPTSSNGSFGSSQCSLDPSESGATVYLRLRPIVQPSPIYTVESNTLKVHTADQNNKEQHYEFSHIFEQNASQSDIYDTCVRPHIDTDESLTLLTYGTSGSGKTFTMHGDDMNSGIIPRAIEHIFTRFKHMVSPTPSLKLDRGNIMIVEVSNYSMEEKLRSRLITDSACRMNDAGIEQQHRFETLAPSKESAVIWLSFAEIYNENVYDLLAETDRRPNKARKNLKIISNEGNAFIKDLTSVNVRTAHEAYAVWNAGLENVNMASTNVNLNSSRSHCIFMVNVIFFTPPADYSYCVYKFCDLAGSERLKKTENVGNRLKEAQRINGSLLVLGRCLDSLYANQLKKCKEVVPFRESKLTLLLQKSLMGREKITTIVNMLPKIEFIEENLHVLHFASIAQKIIYKLPPIVAPTVDPPAPAHKSKRRSTRFSWFASNNQSSKYYTSEEDVACMVKEIMQLREQVEVLLDQADLQRKESARREQDIRNTLVADFEKRMRETNDLWEQRLKYSEESRDEKIQRLEAEIKRLTNNVIEIDDDDDYDDEDVTDDEDDDYDDDEICIGSDETEN